MQQQRQQQPTTTSGDPRSTWCRHYRGHAPHVSKTCAAGIAYDSMAHPHPCVNWGAQPGQPNTWGQCKHFSEYTRDELDEEERQAAEAWAAYVTALNDGLCPHCGASVAKRRQVGRCVYASPCGHRLYQGKA